MKKNLTIVVDNEVAGWARIWAAKHGSSVSKLVGKMLRELMERERGYAAAMKRDIARQPVPLKSESKYPTREELHDRVALR